MTIRNNGKRIIVIGYVIETGINVLPHDFFEVLKTNKEENKRWEDLKDNKVIELL